MMGALSRCTSGLGILLSDEANAFEGGNECVDCGKLLVVVCFEVKSHIGNYFQIRFAETSPRR